MDPLFDQAVLFEIDINAIVEWFINVHKKLQHISNWNVL